MYTVLYYKLYTVTCIQYYIISYIHSHMYTVLYYKLYTQSCVCSIISYIHSHVYTVLYYKLYWLLVSNAAGLDG